MGALEVPLAGGEKAKVLVPLPHGKQALAIYGQPTFRARGMAVPSNNSSLLGYSASLRMKPE